jgi:hypothetical protein
MRTDRSILYCTLTSPPHTNYITELYWKCVGCLIGYNIVPNITVTQHTWKLLKMSFYGNSSTKEKQTEPKVMTYTGEK